MVVKAHGNVKANFVQDGPYGFRIDGSRVNVSFHGAHAAADINANGIGNNNVLQAITPPMGMPNPS